MRRLLRLVAIVALGGLGVGACFAAFVPGAVTLAGSSRYSGKVAPQLKKLSERTLVYDRGGNLLDVLGLQDRQPVKLAQVPKITIDAVIAAEDRTFYENAGVDFEAIIRAFSRNLGSGDVEQGGSTITQQLIKNRYFKKPKRDLDRKLKEIALAVRLNEEWSKDHILEEYLNTVYFGQGAYGIASAAERFFGLPVEKLGVAESALLAALISNPEGYNPFTNPKRARARRAEVLRRMVKQRFINHPVAQFVSQVPLPTKKPPPDLRPDNYYVDEVQRRLLNDPRLGATPTERYNKVFLGGLRVYTAYDPTVQFLAQNAVSTTLPDTRFTAAMAVLDPASGQVRAIVAGPGFDRSQVNLATMPGPGRQPGSTMKAITLTAAIENGFSPDDTVDGTSPCTIHPRGHRGDDLQTRNAEGGGGVMSIRDATVNSVNCAYFRVGAGVGIPKVAEMAKRLGVTHPLNQYYINAIGQGDGVSPLDMATAFGTLAADGVRHDPIFVTKVTDADGNVILENKGEGVRAVDAQVARTVTDVLRGVVTGGTGTRAQLPDRVAAGKTGTTDNEHDAWFTGYTPQLVASVWMGDPAALTPMKNVGRFASVFGGTYPAMIWQKFMSAALEGQPALDFPAPDPSVWRASQFVDENGRHSASSFPAPPPPSTAAPTTTSGPPPAAPALPAPAAPALPAPAPTIQPAPPTSTPAPAPGP